MRFVVLSTPAEQARGLQHRGRVERETMYVFPGVRAGTVFHSRNVPGPFDLAFLSGNWEVLWSGTLVPETATAQAPPGTALALEAGPGVMGLIGLRPGAVVPP